MTISHSVLLKTQKQISGLFNAELIDAIKVGSSFRIIGDNINFYKQVSQEREDGQKNQMEHWFRSAAILQHNSFNISLNDVPPQRPLLEIPLNFKTSIL